MYTLTCDDLSSATMSRIMSASSCRDATLGRTFVYLCNTCGQSHTPESSPNRIPGCHHSSLRRRHVSPSICAHSAPGSTTTSNLPSMSIKPLLRFGAVSSTSSPSLSSSSGLAPALYALNSTQP